MRILFFRTDRLGETVLTLPAVRALKTAMAAEITLVADPGLCGWLQTIPWIDRVLERPFDPAWPWHRQLRACLRLIDGRRFDAAVAANPLKSVHAALWLKRVPRRIGYDRKWGFLLTDRLEGRERDWSRHEVEHNLALLEPLGISMAQPAWDLPRASAEDRARVRRKLGIDPERRIIAIHPWSSNPGKCWPVEHFRRLVEGLSAEGSDAIAVIGSWADQRSCAAAKLEEWPAVNAVGRLSLTELAVLLQESALHIGNDSGPMHLAAAYGVPVVALFGQRGPQTSIARWGPWGGHAVLSAPDMASIDPDSVRQEALRRLQTAV